MLDDTDKRILRALAKISIDENPSENYIAKKTLNPKLKPKKLSTPTVRRRLSYLVENGFVKYLGRGKQRSQKHKLELKGLFYLLSNEKELTDNEIMNVAEATINALPTKRKKKSLLRMFLFQIGKETADIIDQVKHRVNFDFFDEKYVADVFFNAIAEHCLKMGLNIQNSKKIYSQDGAKIDLKALKSNPLLNKGLTLLFEGNFEYSKKERQKAEQLYQFHKKMWETWNDF